MNEHTEIIELLRDKKTRVRRKGALKIAKLKLVALGDELFEAYLKEIEDERTWETQTEMIVALGVIEYKKAKDQLRKIIDKNYLTHLITTEATTAYVRICRTSLHDVKTVFELLEFGNYAIITGAFAALAKDKMQPAPEEIKRLFEIAKDMNKRADYAGQEYGLHDPRLNLANACGNWDVNITKDFLEYCIENCKYTDAFGTKKEDSGLIEVCKNALRGKPSPKHLY